MQKPTKKQVQQALNVIYASAMLEKGSQEFAHNHPGARMRIHAAVVLEVVGSDNCVATLEFDGYELRAN